MNKPIVAFVDDDRFYMASWIESLNDRYDVKHFTRAKDALEYIRSGDDIRCLILDVMMPSPSGVSPSETKKGFETGVWLLRQANGLLKDRYIPIIVLTNRDIKTVEERVSNLRFHDGQVDVRRKIDIGSKKLPNLVDAMITRGNTWRRR